MNSSLSDADTSLAICRLVADLLDMPHVEPDDDLIALGADSMVMTALAGRIRRQWGVTLTFRELMTTPRLGDVADLIVARAQPEVMQRDDDLALTGRMVAAMDEDTVGRQLDALRR